MLAEVRQVKRFLGAKFGYGEHIADGVYAVPTQTPKGDAFMRVEMKNDQFDGDKNFSLFWDEALTIDWYTQSKPFPFLEKKESKFSMAFRILESVNE